MPFYSATTRATVGPRHAFSKIKATPKRRVRSRGFFKTPGSQTSVNHIAIEFRAANHGLKQTGFMRARM